MTTPKQNKEYIKMLEKTNCEMREVGCSMAMAGLRIARDYDGIHRLMLEISKWAKVIANENNRDKLYDQT